MRTAFAKLRDPSRPLLTSLTAPPLTPSPPPLPSPLYLLHFSHYSCIISPCLFRSFPSAWSPFGIRNRNCLIHGNIRREGRRGANKENSRHKNRLPLFSKLQLPARNVLRDRRVRFPTHGPETCRRYPKHSGEETTERV